MGRNQSVIAPLLQVRGVYVKKKLSPEEGKRERESQDEKEESSIIPRVVLRKEMTHV